VLGKIYALLVLTVIGLATLISIPEARANPDITLNKITAISGSFVKVDGVGWVPFIGVPIFFNSSPTLIGTATPDASGSFTITVQIPLDATPGIHAIAAVQGQNIVAQPITITSPQSIPEFPFPFSLVLIFVAVGTIYLVIRQKMITNFRLL
jgi:hypothetical protein